MGLVGLIVASLLNLFFQSGPFALVISFVGVLLFAGLTAYDTQQTKSMYAHVAGTGAEQHVVIMSALFSSGWSGMATIEDIDRGVTDRLLVSPVSRGAIIAGRVTQSAVVIVIQSVIMIGLALAVGASFPGGVVGVLVLILVSALLGAGFAALSNSLALVTRQEESLIGAVTLVVLPLTFLSTALMTADLLPGWMHTVAKYNPVNWAIEAGRSATAANPDWGMIAGYTALLAAGLVLASTLATQAFRAYQRSV